MGYLADARFAHYYNCYNGYFVGCLQKTVVVMSYLADARFAHNYNYYNGVYWMSSLIEH